MAKYAVAYCSPNGSTFSDTEPYIEEAGNTINEIEIVLKNLQKTKVAIETGDTEQLFQNLEKEISSMSSQRQQGCSHIGASRSPIREAASEWLY